MCRLIDRRAVRPLLGISKGGFRIVRKRTIRALRHSLQRAASRALRRSLRKTSITSASP